ncbi:AraC family ligand binding domain-containing protein [Tenacibaculum amylolyticum]|uniref:AraC family ligand binding domain-containing protein n=1 Tax=Tenacibaculum amylolyticum TaxID=104269 RepID=UPI0038967D87
MKQHIENIVFSRFVNQPIPFEFISLEELYKRCNMSGYDLSIPHRIAFHALLVILEGESTHFIDFKEIPLKTGTIIPLSKDQVHAFHKTPTVKGYVISFEEGFITKNISEKNLFHFLHIFNTQTILIPKKHLSNLLPFLSLLKSTHDTTITAIKSEIINSTLMSLFVKFHNIVTHKKLT